MQPHRVFIELAIRKGNILVAIFSVFNSKGMSRMFNKIHCFRERLQTIPPTEDDLVVRNCS